jgi:FKBP-type peptidyl-prolyl cis-trans isomerase FkpA
MTPPDREDPVRRAPLVALLMLAACDLNDFRRTPILSSNDFAEELHVDTDAMTTTPSGLRYQDLAPGSGAVAEPGHEVSVHYTGWLTDGTEFDSSVRRREPYAFQLGRGVVIAGWDEGVAGMKVGGRRKLVIPPGLGYGAAQNGPIPANSTLVFDVELLGVR